MHNLFRVLLILKKKIIGWVVGNGSYSPGRINRYLCTQSAKPLVRQAIVSMPFQQGAQRRPKTPIDLIKANEEISVTETANAVQQ